MANLVDYRGLRVLDPAPTGAGGLAIQDDLKLLADRIARTRYVDGLSLEYLDPTTVRVGPGSALSADGSFDLELGAAVNVDASASGPGGLDAGSASGSTLYYVHVIGDSTGAAPTSALFSDSQSPALPAGYDRFRRVGFAVTDANGELLPFRQSGTGRLRRVHYAASESRTRVLNNGRSTSFATIDCSAFAPVGCRLILFRVRFRNNDTAGRSSGRHARLRCTGDTDDGSLHAFRNGTGTDRGAIGQLEVPCSSGRAVDYRVSHSDAWLRLSVAAVEDVL